MSNNLPLVMPAVPEGFCSTLGPEWVQQILNLVAQGSARFEGVGTVILNQETQPDITQRDLLWRRPSMGSLIFQFITAAWICPHLIPPGSLERRWYEGTPNQIWAYDGGDGSDPSITPPADNVGAMWAIDTNYIGRSPMGPGAISGSDPAKVLTLSENYGTGSHVLTEAQLARHYHRLYADQDQDGGGGGCNQGYNIFFGTAENDDTLNLGDLISCEKTVEAAKTGDNAAHENTHPVRGIYAIKRTARLNYVAS